MRRTSQPWVRAERSGRSNGRAYHILFAATDPAGLSCTGEVTVGVPHDREHPIVDGGALYDSTMRFPVRWHEGDDRDHDRENCSDDRHDHGRDESKDRDDKGKNDDRSSKDKNRNDDGKGDKKDGRERDKS